MAEHHSLDEQMREAIREQREHVKASRAIDRTGWTREQWIADAEKQFDDLHGSILDLVNGHVGAMLVEIGLLRATLGRVRELHKREEIDAITAPECCTDECDHEGQCPTFPVAICRHCWDNAEWISPYFAEEAAPQWVMWPCATIRELDGGGSDG